MLTPELASTSNMVAATPGWVFMPAPTRLMRAMSASWVTPEAPSSLATASLTFSPVGRSVMGRVKEMSVVPLTDVFCTIMSTFTPSSARARKRRAAMPGRSGTDRIVTLASDRSWVTAEMIACSMGASWRTHVPGFHVKLERTWRVTWWLRANSTERRASTRPPVAAISSISS